MHPTPGSTLCTPPLDLPCAPHPWTCHMQTPWIYPVHPCPWISHLQPHPKICPVHPNPWIYRVHPTPGSGLADLTPRSALCTLFPGPALCTPTPGSALCTPTPGSALCTPVPGSATCSPHPLDPPMWSTRTDPSPTDCEAVYTYPHTMAQRALGAGPRLLNCPSIVGRSER